MYRLLLALTLGLLFSLGCAGGGSSDDDDDDTTDEADADVDADADGDADADADCSSTASGVDATTRDWIEATCEVEVNCGVTSCESCVASYEESYLASDTYVQEQYASALECLEQLTCTEWQNEDYSRCTGDSCGGIYCGSDDSVCSSSGCGYCGADGYCE